MALEAVLPIGSPGGGAAQRVSHDPRLRSAPSAQTAPRPRRGPFRFCPYCATALEPCLLEDRRWPACPACGYVAATGQRLAAGVIVARGRSVLLLQRRRPPVGAWELPGGYVDRGESPRAAAERELHEETGLALHDPVLFAVFTDERASAVCYVGPTTGVQRIRPGEHTAARFFTPDEIPWEQLRSPTHAAALRAWLAAHPPLVAFVGHSGSGKTTLMEAVIRMLAAHGLRVGAIKHDPKGHAAYDHSGKDSWRYREAGARLVALAGPHTAGAFRALAGDRPLVEVAAELAAAQPLDLVLAEGYNMQTGFPKIEVYRPVLGRPPRATAQDVIAVATDAASPVPGLEALPHLPLNDPPATAAFLLHTCGLPTAG